MDKIAEATKVVRYFLILVIAIGFLARLFLAAYMPIWRDEGFSIWTASNGLLEVFFGQPDNAHPPGYYVFLSLIYPLTNNLILMRLISMTHYLISCILLWRIGIARNKLYALVLLSVFACSGYFLVIDWQIRSYTWTFCLMLLSIWLRTKRESYGRTKYLVAFVILHAWGMYFDYSYWWYCLGLAMYNLYLNFKESKKSIWDYQEVWGLSMSFLIFWVIYPKFFGTINGAKEGVAWATHFIKTDVFIPYFLGTVKFVGLTFIYKLLWVFGLWRLIKEKYFIDSPLLIGGVVSFIVSVIVTLLYSPLFHVRHLILVGVISLLVVAEAVYYSLRYPARWVVMVLIIFGGINTFLLLISKPAELEIVTYPWRQRIPRYEHLSKERIFVIDGDPKYELMPFDVWPLEYTLEGRDVLLGVSHEYGFNSNNYEDCQLLLNPLYDCKKD
jgi:hypothetical protein